LSESEDVIAEEISEEEGTGESEEGEGVEVSEFSIESLELMLSRVEEWDRLLEGAPLSTATEAVGPAAPARKTESKRRRVRGGSRKSRQ